LGGKDTCRATFRHQGIPSVEQPRPEPSITWFGAHPFSGVRMARVLALLLVLLWAAPSLASLTLTTPPGTAETLSGSVIVAPSAQRATGSWYSEEFTPNPDRLKVAVLTNVTDVTGGATVQLFIEAFDPASAAWFTWSVGTLISTVTRQNLVMGDIAVSGVSAMVAGGPIPPRFRLRYAVSVAAATFSAAILSTSAP
jgi:hypothetical protein